MRTQRVGSLAIDETRLAADLRRSSEFHYSEAYSEYLIGGPWRSCALWAPGGDTGDGTVTNYDSAKPPLLTPEGHSLPYVAELIEQSFSLSRLTFARLAIVSGSVIIPHRDLLELDDVPDHARNAHRVHVPLKTTGEAFFSEQQVVYRMETGEVWFFDASTVHSAASFSEDDRIHLILDFSAAGDGAELLNFAPDPESGIPAGSVYMRNAMTAAEREALLGLAHVINLDNYRDVFSIVIKQHYRKDGGDDFVWETLLAIADACEDEAVRAKVREMHTYFLIKRDP
jgi:hypothetical protein